MKYKEGETGFNQEHGILDWDYIMAICDLLEDGKMTQPKADRLLKEAENRFMPDGIKRSKARQSKFRKSIL